MRRKSGLHSSLSILCFGALLLGGLSGCVKPNINFESTFVNNSNTNIVLVDTFSVKMSTVYVDSFPSGATGAALVGRLSDPYLGLTTTKSYFQVSPPRGITNVIFDQNGTYDSLVFMCRLNKYFYGDTSVSQRFVVSQLTEQMQFPGTQQAFYSNDSIPYDPTPLGFTDVLIQPRVPNTSLLANDTVKIRLPDALGQDLYDRMLVKDPSVTNANSFLGWFHGLVMYSGSKSASAIFGFKDTVFMRIYYHEPGVVLQSKHLDFSVYQKSYLFNQVTVDRTGTVLQSLTNATGPAPGIAPEISSDSTGQVAFVQGGTGLQTKLRFPTLWKLPQFVDYLSILKAQLIVRPIGATYDPLISLPPKLGIYLTDNRNFLGPPLVSGAIQTGNLVTDYIYGINSTYTYDLTNYLKSQVLAGQDLNQKNGLMLYLPSPDYLTTFNRTILGDRTNSPSNRVTLQIYYASYY